MTPDWKAWAKSPRRYWRDALLGVAEKPVNWMGPSYEGKDQLRRDEATRSVSLAGQTIMLTAKAMG